MLIVLVFKTRLELQVVELVCAFNSHKEKLAKFLLNNTPNQQEGLFFPSNKMLNVTSLTNY
jgi:hypothetical protein